MEMMKKLGDRHHRLLHLPEDIIVFKILVRLPVVEVIRCTSVCKQWYALIKTPLFISTHLSLSSSSSSSSRSSKPWVFVDGESSTLRRRVLSSHFDPQSFREDCRSIPFPFPVVSYGVVLGPIRGLFFLSKGEVCCLWNPSLRRYISIPSPITSSFNDNTIMYGFAFDAKNEDFKVFAWKNDHSHGSHYQLFSMKQGSWRTLVAEEPNYYFVTCNGYFINGTLYWLVQEPRTGDIGLLVLAFDIADETFKRIKLPEEVRQAHDENDILEIKGSLASYMYNHVKKPGQHRGPTVMICYNIWVMQEYGVANSWVKMWTIQLMGVPFSRFYGFWGNGDDILMGRIDYRGVEELFLYNTKTHGTRHFGGVAKPSIFRIHSYSESLILLDKESGAVSYD